MQSADGVQDNIQKIAQLFPSCVTETIVGYHDDSSAIVKNKVDFEMLQQELSDAVVSGREERYQFTWPDKRNLFNMVDNVKPDRTSEDLLFQVMLELGATLDSKIEETAIAGKTIYNVADNYLVACFDQDVTDEVVTAIAKMQPMYAVFRDTSMKTDSIATNFEQIFKTYSPNTVTKIL